MMRDGETGEMLHRDVRPMIVSYHGRNMTIDMPGWYPDGDGDGTFTKEDLLVYNKAIVDLKNIGPEGNRT